MTNAAPITRQQLRSGFVPRVGVLTCKRTGTTYRYQSLPEGPLSELESYQSSAIRGVDENGNPKIDRQRYEQITKTGRHMVLRETLLDGETTNRMYGDSDAELDAIAAEIDSADAAELFDVICTHIGLQSDPVKELETDAAKKNLRQIVVDALRSD